MLLPLFRLPASLVCRAAPSACMPADLQATARFEAVEQDDGQPVLVAGEGVVQRGRGQLAQHRQAVQAVQGHQGLLKAGTSGMPLVVAWEAVQR